MTENGVLVRLEGIGKRFGAVAAVKGLTLDIRANEFFALLGPSGCGKTTLLRLLAGFETASEGRILLDGENIGAVPPHRRPINMMFQNYALFPHLNVERNIAFGLRQERAGRGEIADRVAEMLSLVQLRGFGGASRIKAFRRSASARGAWRARWSSVRACCCWMSRWPRSTRSCAPRPSSS